MSKEINYEELRKLVTSPEWPRGISDFPKDIKTNCWGFALDMPGIKLDSIFGSTQYDNLNLLTLFEEVGLTYRQIQSPAEKSADEYVIIVYEYTYWRYDSFQKQEMKYHEVHLARVELDGTLVEKPSWVEPIHSTTLAELNALIAADASEDSSYTGPTYIAVRKPR